MTFVHRAIIEHWRWWELVRWRTPDDLLIMLEEGNDHRQHLTSNPPKHLQFAFIGAGPFVVSTFPWNQPVIQYFPRAILLDGVSDNHKHQAFDRPGACGAYFRHPVQLQSTHIALRNPLILVMETSQHRKGNHRSRTPR